MLPSIFPKIIACTDTKAALTGTDDITRFFEFADADHNSQLPYATWQLLSGTPDEYLTCVPDGDDYSFQVDVWAKTGASVTATAKLIRDCLQEYYVCDFMGGTEKDFETGYYRYILRFAGREDRA